jgi:hypothetical protein
MVQELAGILSPYRRPIQWKRHGAAAALSVSIEPRHRHPVYLAPCPQLREFRSRVNDADGNPIEIALVGRMLETAIGPAIGRQLTRAAARVMIGSSGCVPRSRPA